MKILGEICIKFNLAFTLVIKAVEKYIYVHIVAAITQSLFIIILFRPASLTSPNQERNS